MCQYRICKFNKTHNLVSIHVSCLQALHQLGGKNYLKCRKKKLHLVAHTPRILLRSEVKAHTKIKANIYVVKPGAQRPHFDYSVFKFCFEKQSNHNEKQK